MKKLKNAKGITLIALVITIIVMLILVGVTVNTALKGGLFNKTREAAKETTIAKEKEQLTALMAGEYDASTGKININNIKNQLENMGWTVSENNVTSPSGNEFIISENGEIKLNEVKYEEIFKTATKHPNQTKTNDIGIAEDGSVVNLDLWNYEYQFNETTGFSLGTAGSVGCTGYDNSNVVNGEIQGKVPMYIKEEGKSSFYPVTMMYATFARCTSLVKAPEIPSTVNDMSEAFMGCTSLEFAPVIPSGVLNLATTFRDCENLKGELIINSEPTYYGDCLTGVSPKNGNTLKLKGNCSKEKLELIKAASTLGSYRI